MKKTLLTWLLILTSLITFAADKPISGLTIYNGAPGTNDLIPFVNRADVTQSTNGSTRSMTWSNLNYSLRTSYPAMTLSNMANFGSYVYVTNLGVYSDGGTPLTVGGIGGAGGYNVDTSGNLQFYGNSTFTSSTTNNFVGRVLLTNMNNTISGNGAGLTNFNFLSTGIRLRSLFFTNIFFPNIYFSSNSVYPGSPTNASDWGTLSNKVKMTLPGLLSTNSTLLISVGVVRTNGTPERVSMMMYGGAATNPFYYATTFISTSANPLQNPSGGSGGTLAFANYGSFTNQIPAPNSQGFYQDRFGTNICGDTSQPFDVYLGWCSLAAGYVETNHLFIIRAFEVVD